MRIQPFTPLPHSPQQHQGNLLGDSFAKAREEAEANRPPLKTNLINPEEYHLFDNVPVAYDATQKLTNLKVVYGPLAKFRQVPWGESTRLVANKLAIKLTTGLNNVIAAGNSSEKATSLTLGDFLVSKRVATPQTNSYGGGFYEEEESPTPTIRSPRKSVATANEHHINCSGCDDHPAPSKTETASTPTTNATASYYDDDAAPSVKRASTTASPKTSTVHKAEQTVGREADRIHPPRWLPMNKWTIGGVVSACLAFTAFVLYDDAANPKQSAR